MNNKLLTDYVQTFDDALAPETCSQMILDFEAAPMTLTKIEGFREFHELPVNQLGSSIIAGVGDAKPKSYTELLMEAMRKHLNEYQRRCAILPGDWPTSVAFEKFRMKRYEQGIGQFARHVDVGDHASARRFMVFFFYLNDVDEGGETVFFNREGSIALAIKPKRGTLLMFPPLWLFPHAGLMPRSGPKYIAGGYLHYT